VIFEKIVRKIMNCLAERAVLEHIFREGAWLGLRRLRNAARGTIRTRTLDSYTCSSFMWTLQIKTVGPSSISQMRFSLLDVLRHMRMLLYYPYLSFLYNKYRFLLDPKITMPFNSDHNLFYLLNLSAPSVLIVCPRRREKRSRQV
jgi:hypothetical protein